MSPNNPASAACYPNPYPYYSNLLTGPDLYFDDQLRCWVASRAAVVQEILEHPHCMVRPTTEAVPSAIVGSSAGAVFSQLIRMNDGVRHQQPKFAIQQALAGLDVGNVQARSRYFSSLLAARYGLTQACAISVWMFDLPVYVVGDLLGFGEAELPDLALWMADFVRCLSPLSSTSELDAASTAASALLARLRQMLEAANTQTGSLLQGLQTQAHLTGWADLDAILANLIGLLSQTYEATAGLIGNSLVALLTRPALQGKIRAEPALTHRLIEEVCRYDPAIQNTRRYVAQPISIAGIKLEAGATLLLLLAAAGRDKLAHSAADEFLLDRPTRRLFGFGHGRHACPGQKLACGIAVSAISTMLELTPQFDPNINWHYRASLNARMPLFTDTKESLS
jgi:cytochrome P450